MEYYDFGKIEEMADDVVQTFNKKNQLKLITVTENQGKYQL
jgi:hypothetical protein